MQYKLDRSKELERLRQRYGSRGKLGKTRLLDEFCEHYGYSRKHGIKLLGGAGVVRREPGPGPEPRYEPIREVVERIWGAAEQLCGKRLQPALGLWVPHYGEHFGGLLPSQKKLLREVSAATIDRLLRSVRRRQKGRLGGTKPGTLLRTQIPLSADHWDQSALGYLEADTVAHCGNRMGGDFIWSLVYTDMASAWTEGRAIWNKGAASVLEQTRQVEGSLPFKVLGFDCDNGGEFLNWHLVRYFQERAKPVGFTRSRPYHKDDNAHVEQKNWMWPRQLLGYGRLEDPALVPLISALYKEVWGPLQNFFLPSMKLVKKERVGSRWVRQHSRPLTAYQRLLSSGQVEAKQLRRLQDWHAQLDPFVLARQVERRLKSILQTAAVAA